MVPALVGPTHPETRNSQPFSWHRRLFTISISCFSPLKKKQEERQRLSGGVGGHEQDGGRGGAEGVVGSGRRTTYADVFRMSKGKTCCSKMRRGGSGLHLLPTDDVVAGDISPCNVSVGAAGVINQLQAGARLFFFVVVSKRRSSGCFDVVLRRRRRKKKLDSQRTKCLISCTN